MSNWHETFNWNKAIEINRDALLAILAQLYAMIGAAPGAQIETLPRHLRNLLAQVLRPAESATRRLIFLLARDIKTEPLKISVAKAGRVKLQAQKSAGETKPMPRFKLLDPRKTFSFNEKPRREGKRPLPRISVPGVFDPVFLPEPTALTPDDPTDASKLIARLTVLKAALDDLPTQAKRLVRLRQRVEARFDGKAPWNKIMPMRPGLPPGYRRRSKHPVDAVLMECDRLAHYALE